MCSVAMDEDLLDDHKVRRNLFHQTDELLVEVGQSLGERALLGDANDTRFGQRCSIGRLPLSQCSRSL